MGSWVHDMSLHKTNLVCKWISGFVKSILLSDYVFLSVHRLVLIRNSLCAYSPRPCSIRLKPFCVCGMMFAFKWATVPSRSPSLCWCHQSHTSLSSFAPPHILHIRRRDRDLRGGGLRVHKDFMSEEWEWTKASGLNSVIAFSGCRQLWYVIHK